ncbi:MAG TPA: FliA/WhiG family RNA polymerase sigma factor [Candidatus Methylacidiphilales bacterium]|jgi:RNA polymerase sigma factor for flagellar operon FliA|nr:FliA/WhiG family RNA polymerase sigma factor [Candidatus Methylacidiphilales bacterium]
MGYESDRLLEFLPWARHFARSCTSKLPSHLDHDDLQSAGVLGYLRAASRYDAARGASFRGYCALRIRGAVLDELRRWDWAPRSVHKNQRRITRITSNLTEQLEREPTRLELAAALGVDETDLTAYQTYAQPRQLVSLDEINEIGHSDESLSLKERLADPSAVRPDASVLSAEDRRTMLQCLGCLSKTQSTVIVLHYLQNVPFREVAEILAVSPSRVSQLHRQALARLKQAWQRSDARA